MWLQKRRPHGGKSKHVLVAGQGTPNSCTPAVKTARPNSCTPAVKTARLNTLRTSTAKPIEVAHSIAKSTGKPSEVRTKTKHEEAKEKSKKHEAKETSKAKVGGGIDVIRNGAPLMLAFPCSGAHASAARYPACVYSIPIGERAVAEY